MASEEKKSAKSGKKNIFTRMGSGIAKWFRELKSELKKVIWPTPKQLLNNTVVVLVVMAVFAVVLWGFDTVASKGVEALISFIG